MFEFGVASALFVPTASLAMMNLIQLVGGLARIMKEGCLDFQNMVLQLLLCSLIVRSSYPIFKDMVIRNNKGHMPTSITMLTILLACLLPQLHPGKRIVIRRIPGLKTIYYYAIICLSPCMCVLKLYCSLHLYFKINHCPRSLPSEYE